jgi:hypothetical protein
MPRPRIPHAAIDTVIAKLHEINSTPRRIQMVSAELPMLLPRVSNLAHRQFLEQKWHEMERMQNSPRDLARISDEIDSWSDREFPVQGK